MSSTVSSSMSGGWYAFWYQPEPITMLRPVALETRSSPSGSRWMPVLVISTIESPPILRNSIASRMARSSSERIQLSKIDLLDLARCRFSSVSFSPQRATSEAGDLSSGATCFVSAMKRCSCIIVVPRSSGSIGPATVMILPVGVSSMASPHCAHFAADDAACYQRPGDASTGPGGTVQKWSCGDPHPFGPSASSGGAKLRAVCPAEPGKRREGWGTYILCVTKCTKSVTLSMGGGAYIYYVRQSGSKWDIS